MEDRDKQPGRNLVPSGVPAVENRPAAAAIWSSWLNPWFVFPALVFLTTFVGYLITISPTTSFWDCGEFIASSWILGVPHPPGTPFYILLGRVWALLPLGGEIAFRINLLSALCSALAASLIVWIVAFVLDADSGDGRLSRNSLIIWCGGVAGGFYAAFSFTLWNNAIEAELYASAMFLMGLVLILTILWGKGLGKPGNDRKIILILFLLGISIGNHLMSFLVAPAVFVYVYLLDRKAGISLLVSAILFFLAYNAGLELLDQETYSLWMIVLAVAAFLVLLFLAPAQFDWDIIGWGLALFIVGLTIHFYLPIRAAFNPAINEGDPSTVNAFFDMINRKQYAPPSIFERQAPFHYQLQMFWDYLVIQWSHRLLAFVPLLLGIWGIQRHYRQGERRFFWAFLVLFLICSLGLVLYINFKLAPAQALDKFPDDALHEVRERDYFYTPTYYFFAVWIGLGTSALLLWFRRQTLGLKPSLRRGMTVLTALVLLGIMAVPTIYNGRRNDRSRNLVAHDFGLNLLNSVGNDGILYTNGDNDTFPLWFLQNVKEVRQDVTVLNLSLLKTPWYPKQLKHGPTKVPISYSDQRLDRVAFAQVPKDMQIRSGNLLLPLKKGQLLSPEHQIMYDIVLTNKWKRPTYFAVSVPDKGGFDDYLTLEGLVMRLTQKKSQTPMSFDLEACGRNMVDMYNFRGVFDTDIPKDEETRARITNYGTAYILLAEENLRRGNKAAAIPFLHNSISILSLMPENRQYQRLLQSLSQWLGEVYLDKGMLAEARAVYQRILDLLGRSPSMHLGLGVVAHREGDYDTAIANIREAYRQEPNNPLILNNLYIVLADAGRTEEAREALESYVKLRPDDERAQKLLQEMRPGPENN